MKSSVSISRNGRSIRATGAAANALFLAMTQGLDTADATASQPPGRVDCGECPNVTGGCAVGHCAKASPIEQPRVQIGPLDI